MERYINPEKIDFRLPYFEDENGDALVSLRAVKQCIDATPTADVVEVVRCEDCKNCDIVYPLKFLGIEAIEEFYCVLDNRRVLSTDYCSRGERKE